MQEVITAKDNAQVKHVAALLTRRRTRDEEGLFVIEGLRLCLDALQSGVRVRLLLATPQAHERWPALEAAAQAAGRAVLISEAVAAKIADTVAPQGVFAVCEKLDIRDSAATMNTGGIYLLLENIRDPGNLGAILRTADAMGTDGVWLSPGCADLYSPKVLRAAMGGLFRLPVTPEADLAGVLRALRGAGLPAWAAALAEDARAAGEVSFAGGGAVAIGNEGAGLTAQTIAGCTGCIRIPMAPGANSLNAAVAAGVLLWEMRRTSLKR